MTGDRGGVDRCRSAEAAGGGLRNRVIAAGLAGPALALLVALVQIWAVGAHDLSRWKGGGFGMFAALDAPQHRAVRSYGRVDGSWTPIKSGPVAAAEGFAARTLPSEAAMGDWARTLLQQPWRMRPDDTLVPAAGRGPGPAEIDGLRIQVWSPVYDRQTGDMRLALVREWVRHARSSDD